MSNAASIRLIVSDVDGVLTDGRIIYSGENGETKEFNVRDGLAVKLAQKKGIRVALLTSRRSAALERRARELGITELHQGAAEKVGELQKIMSAAGVEPGEVLYAGDDLPDLGPMAICAISAAPADAAEEVHRAATWKLRSSGGRGAFREIVERLLKERGEWDALIQDFIAGKPEARSI